MGAVLSFAEHQLFLEKAEQAKVISFDFFDTLYIRPLAHPEDAFDIIGRKFGIPNFRSLRRAAQAEAFQRMSEAGNREITLAGIYACLANCGTPATVLMQAEYDLELALVEPNPELFPLFCELVSIGKPVVITSDMYLSEHFFKSALHPYGMDKIPLFISADRNATKRDSGELFRALSQELNVDLSDILHIGDNELGDVTRPAQLGLKTFHYRASLLRAVDKSASLATSLAQGLLYTQARSIPKNSYSELGFVYGGTSNLGFLSWIKEAALRDRIDHVLFMSRDGYALNKIASETWGKEMPSHCYFLGSRTAYTLASITAHNFTQFIPFFVSGSDGLAPFELLERIGVRPPAAEIMSQLGLGADVKVSPLTQELICSFIYAYRWEILKVCRRNRIALRRYLTQIGLRDGDRVALVDVGWSGTTQEAFELAVRPLMNLEVHGYYLCLADTSERIRRADTQRMSALISSNNTPARTISKIYENRVSVELFFSAPHSSVIGLDIVNGTVDPIYDRGRGRGETNSDVMVQICEGVNAFAQNYANIATRFDTHLQADDLVMPILELINDSTSYNHMLLSKICSFDAWGSSANHEFSLKDYV